MAGVINGFDVQEAKVAHSSGERIGNGLRLLQYAPQCAFVKILTGSVQRGTNEQMERCLAAQGSYWLIQGADSGLVCLSLMNDYGSLLAMAIYEVN